jgi:hypothetical protein
MYEYRAIFEYPTPWAEESTRVGHGPARETREEAEADRPWRPEESHGRHIGVQSRRVHEWRDLDLMGECKHGIPLVSTIGGPSAYCADCTAALMENPRYYEDGEHL